MNRIDLIGRIGNDLEIKNGCLSFSLATSFSYKTDSGEKKEETSWHNVVMFHKSAENFVKYHKKGSVAFITGRVRYNKHDGKIYTQIICNEWRFLPKDSTGSNQSNDNSQPEPVQSNESGDGLPF